MSADFDVPTNRGSHRTWSNEPAEYLGTARVHGQAEAALDRPRAVLNEAFEAAGSAFRDDAVRDDIRDVGRLLGEALYPTVTRVGGEVRDLFEHR